MCIGSVCVCLTGSHKLSGQSLHAEFHSHECVCISVVSASVGVGVDGSSVWISILSGGRRSHRLQHRMSKSTNG